MKGWGGVGGVGLVTGTRHFFRSIKHILLASPDSRNRFFEMAPEWVSNRIRSVKQVLLALGSRCLVTGGRQCFSLDKTNTLSSTGSQTLRTQWFGDTFVIPRDNSNIFNADRRSDTT